MATSQDTPQDISLTTGPLNRLDNPTDREQSTIRHGKQAWHRLRQDHSWEDWQQVGAALVIGRRGAMRDAAVNRPVGRRYNVLFAAWLKQFGFENLDKADRSRLFAVMDHLEEIEAWRASLKLPERLRLNHPSAVLRKWKSANAISANPNSRLSPIKKCRQENSPLQREIPFAPRLLPAIIGIGPKMRDVDARRAEQDKAAAVAGAIIKGLEENC